MRPISGWKGSILPAGLITIALPWLIVSCGGGGSSVEQQVIRGKVIDGYLEGALVCIDLNRNGRCDDDGSARVFTDSTGSYTLSIPKGSTAPLIAEVVAGQSRDAGPPPAAVAASYRMASPSSAYSTNITPFSTLVHLCAAPNYSLAEGLVRDVLGLPPKFAINIDAAPAAGSLTQSVAASVVAALQATERDLDMSSTEAMQKVAAALPRSLTDLPVLRITTKNGAPIVSKEEYVDATFVLSNPAAANPTANLSGKIRGRGHSTWGQPKNPYKVQFKEDAAWAALGDVLGMKKNRNWALLADYFDRSLMRNKLAFSLANSSAFADGLKWTPSGQHLEVYLNEDYVGVYLLTEDIRLAPERLNLKKMSSSATVNDLDGGYIVEVDARLDCYNGADLSLQHVTPQGAPICIDTPDEGAITPNQLAWIKALLNNVEQDIYTRSRMDRINPASFADWYLLSELFRNNDAVFWTSDFMWKDTDAAASPADRLVNMGPIWDFDLSAGNFSENESWKTEGCWVARALPYSPNWIARLFDNPDFLSLTLARWKLKRPAIEKFINESIDTYARRLDQPQRRNFARWPILGAQLTNHYTFATYADEVAFLRSFLNERMAWLDRAYESPESFNALCR